MQGGVSRFAWLVALAVVLAGCSGSPGPAEDQQLAPRDFDGPGAEVSGNVLDEEGLPVAGAAVALVDSAKEVVVETQTGDDGGFSLGRVPEGSWAVYVQALGFKPNVKMIQVSAEANQELSIVLVKVPVPTAWHDLQLHTFDITVGLAWQAGGDFNQGCIRPGVTCQGLAIPAPNHAFQVEELEGSPLASIVLEEEWLPNSAVCAKGIAIDFYGPDTDSTQNPSFSNPHYWTNYPSDVWPTTSPVMMVIHRVAEGDPNAIEDPARVEKNGGPLGVEGEWTVRNFPPGRGLTNQAVDFNCFTQQTMDVYFTAFYLEQSPPTYTARPDV